MKRIELEIDSISIRYEDEISILEHPLAIDLRMQNISLKNRDVRFEFLNITSNQVTKQKVPAEDTSLTLKITNASLYWIPDAPMYVPTSMLNHSVDKPMGIFNYLEMDEFRHMFQLKIDSKCLVLAINNLLTNITLVGQNQSSKM